MIYQPAPCRLFGMQEFFDLIERYYGTIVLRDMVLGALNE